MLRALTDRGVRPTSWSGRQRGAVNALWVAHPGTSVGSPAQLARVWEHVCPVTFSAVDVSHAGELILRAQDASAKWLREGGLELIDPSRFLSLHDHGHSAHT